MYYKHFCWRTRNYLSLIDCLVQWKGWGLGMRFFIAAVVWLYHHWKYFCIYWFVHVAIYINIYIYIYICICIYLWQLKQFSKWGVGHPVEVGYELVNSVHKPQLFTVEFGGGGGRGRKGLRSVQIFDNDCLSLISECQNYLAKPVWMCIKLVEDFPATCTMCFKTFDMKTFCT